ncbi:MAG: hypothetical protein ACRYGO_06080 [Janthinobacterium lividum]
MFFDIIFPAIFSVVVAVAMFLAASAKAHVRPWIFFGGAIAAIMGSWAIGSLEAMLAPSSTASAPELSNMAQLMNLTCGAFAGALASAAITNRAKSEHDRESLAIREEYRLALEMETFNRNKLGTARTRLEAVQHSPDPAAKMLAQLHFDTVEERYHLCAERLKGVRTKADMLGVQVDTA